MLCHSPGNVHAGNQLEPELRAMAPYLESDESSDVEWQAWGEEEDVSVGYEADAESLGCVEVVGTAGSGWESENEGEIREVERRTQAKVDPLKSELEAKKFESVALSSLAQLSASA